MSRLGMLLLCTGLLVGCSDDDGSGPNAGVEGTYSIHTYNGQQLPVVVQEEAGQFTVTLLSSTLVFSSGGTVNISERYRLTQGTTSVEETFTATGTWNQTGNNVSVTVTEDGETATLTGVFNGSNQLTFTQEGDVIVYRK
jgi:hypothetical protein